MPPKTPWPVANLEELTADGESITYGVVKPGDEDSGGVAFIRGGDIAGGRILTDQLRTISPAISTQYRRTLLRGGELLVSLVGNPGQVALVPPELAGANIARQVGLVRLSSTVDAQFARYFLSSPMGQAALGAQLLGSVQQVINLRDLKRVEIPLPPIPEQQAITSVLASLDDKIEQNRRTGRALEVVARATFKAWFVDFEPVRAKAAGAAGFPGMPAATFAALPSRLADSALGPVPEGWAVRPISEAFEVNPPRRLAKGASAPYLDMKNMPTDGYAPAAWEQRPVGSGMKFVNGDTLVARITPCLENGKTAFVNFLAAGEVAWGSTEYIVLRPKPPVPGVFAYCLARTPGFREFAIQNMTGTSGRQRVAASAMEHYQIAVPGTTVATAFGAIAEPLFELIRAGMNESRKLAALRDYLLPRLLGGRVRVGEAARMTSASGANMISAAHR